MQTCQKCSERATLHITEIDDDDIEEVHLCYKCAEQYLNDDEPDDLPEPDDPAEMIAAVAAAADIEKTAACPLCKTSFNQFRTSGRLGCPNDYEVFRELLVPLLENIHGGVQHIGKVPRRLPMDAQLQSRLIQLRNELQQAVGVEDYEKAAKLRDEIETLEE